MLGEPLLGRECRVDIEGGDVNLALDQIPDFLWLGIPTSRCSRFRLCGPVSELDDGRVVAFEVKAAERVPGNEFAGLRTLRDRVGDRFVAGVALALGSRSYTFADRLHVMPVDRLWRTVAA